MATSATLMAGTPGRKLLAAGPAQDLTDWTPAEASPLPEFKWTTADGTVRTMADLAGQGVVLNFWATWCVPCVVEMPALDDLARQMAAEGVAVLALSSDRGGAAVVTKFFQDKGITTLPVLLDPRGEAARAFGAKGLPTT